MGSLWDHNGMIMGECGMIRYRSTKMIQSYLLRKRDWGIIYSNLEGDLYPSQAVAIYPKFRPFLD